MPNMSSLSTLASVHPLQRSPLDLGKVVRGISLNGVRNGVPATFACRLSEASGHHYRDAAGTAIRFAYDVIAHATETATARDMPALNRTLGWMVPGGESLGQMVLARLTALGAMHAGVEALLEASPEDGGLLDCKAKLERSIVAIGVAAGRCEHAPDGCARGGRTDAVNAAMREARDRLEKCAGKLDRQAMLEAVALRVLPGPMMRSIQERLPQLAAQLASSEGGQADLMNVLQKEMATATQATIDNLLDVGHGEDVQNALMTLLKLPEYVVEALPGKNDEPDPEAPAKNDPGVRDVLSSALRYGGNVNYAPVTVKTDQGGASQVDFVNAFIEAMKTGYEWGVKCGELSRQLDYVRNANEKLLQNNERLVGDLNAERERVAAQKAEIDELSSRLRSRAAGEVDVEKRVPPVRHAEQREAKRESVLFDLAQAGPPGSVRVMAERVAAEERVPVFQAERAFELDVDRPVHVEVRAQQTTPDDEFKSYVNELNAGPDHRAYGRSRSMLSDGELVEARADLPNTTVNVADLLAFQRARSSASPTTGSEPVSRRSSVSSRMSGSTSDVSVFDSRERVAGRRLGQREPVAGTKPELQSLFDAIKLKRGSGEQLPLQAVVREKRGLSHSVGTQDAINQGDRILRNDWRARASSTASLTSSQAEHLRGLTNVEPRPVDMERIRSFDVDALHARLWAAAERPESETGDDMVVQKSMLSHSYFAASRDSGLDESTGGEDTSSHVSSLERADAAKMNSVTMSARLLAEIQEKRAALNSSAPFIVRSSSGKGWGVWPGQRP